MNPLAIAVQGIGYGLLLVAAQGFVEVPSVPVPEPVRKIQTSSGSNIATLRSLRATKKRAEDKREAENHLLRLQQDDQLATEFIVALVTKGFFNVC